MVELTKRDIEAVANNRFMRSHWKHFVLYLCSLIALILGIGLTLPTGMATWVKMVILLTPTLAMYIFGMVWWQRAIKVATQNLINDCEGDGGLAFTKDV